ncbi:hypothetical protein TAMA11512_06440 [Selenomonas sp. TAMA-11512]|uniref:AAA family ATPase n=1 Tax=Selenomonas sp. TAMA-11512 TaxID=3095337 RepID=UPI0030916C2E|nr:hypothetical protein TAMA11512_06440 [Selenomonas sp. TAMA-11512]
MAKEELGDDAVYLHSKKIKVGGILGYGARELLEASFAVDDSPKVPKRYPKLPSLDEVPPPPNGKSPSEAVLAVGSSTASPFAPAVPKQMLASYKTAGTEAGVEAAGQKAGEPSQEVKAAKAKPQVAETKPQVQDTFFAKDAGEKLSNAFEVVEALKEPETSEEASGVLHGVPIDALMTALAEEEAREAEAERARAAVRAAKAMEEAQPARTEAAATISPAQPANTTTPAVKLDIAPTQESSLTEEEEDSLVDDRPSRRSKERENQQTIDRLTAELAQMKALLVEVANKEKEPGEELSLQQTLRQQEVSESIIDDVIRSVTADCLLASRSSEEARRGLADYLEKNLIINEGLGIKARRRKIAALIGPTGVGKTTTLAKIAAQCVLEKGISAALITADTYRISAVEQLKTYSDILGLPIEIVYNAKELKDAIQKFRTKQLILIDTAGRSQYNRRQMQELKELLAVNPNIEKHLVISATTKEQDAKDIVEQFSACRPDKLIFTKTDETKSLGLLLNMTHQKPLGISFFTTGQSVPDDIVEADAGKLAELFLR